MCLGFHRHSWSGLGIITLSSRTLPSPFISYPGPRTLVYLCAMMWCCHGSSSQCSVSDRKWTGCTLS
ncbi:mCG131841 [Mus musculus]|nr:mCG131841 [Mus musculus]